MTSVGFQLWFTSVPPPEQTDDASAPARLSAVRAAGLYAVSAVLRSLPGGIQTTKLRPDAALLHLRRRAMRRVSPARPRRSSPAAVTRRC